MSEFIISNVLPFFIILSPYLILGFVCFKFSNSLQNPKEKSNIRIACVLLVPLGVLSYTVPVILVRLGVDGLLDCFFAIPLSFNACCFFFLSFVCFKLGNASQNQGKNFSFRIVSVLSVLMMLFFLIFSIFFIIEPYDLGFIKVINILGGSVGALLMITVFLPCIILFGDAFSKQRKLSSFAFICIFFLTGHSLFLCRSGIVFFKDAAKPAIYIYSPTSQIVNVKLEYEGEIFASYPLYNETTKGWSVIADSEGYILDTQDDAEYSYLFWEGKSSKPINWNLDKGFVVSGDDTRAFLQHILAEIGLTPREYDQFIFYWYPRMAANKYNLVHFAGQQYEDLARLSVSPTPDSVLRVFMVFKAIDKPIEIEKQTFQPFKRQGLTIVEWGGTEITSPTKALFE